MLQRNCRAGILPAMNHPASFTTKAPTNGRPTFASYNSVLNRLIPMLSPWMFQRNCRAGILPATNHPSSFTTKAPTNGRPTFASYYSVLKRSGPILNPP